MQKFRGESAAWPEFRRKWMERLGLLQASGPVDEKILLTQFLECVDPTTKREIEARRAEEPNLGYQQIFQEVDQRFSRTVKQTSRAKLQALTLQWVKGERVTMREFSKFDADFRILKADCRGMGEDEAKNIYQSALPLFLAEAVQKELLRKERRPTALLQGLGPFPIKQARECLDEILSTSFHHISNENGNFVVHCVDDTQFRKLMGLNGRALSNGQVISITARDAQVNLEEIRKICHDVLEPRELVQEMKMSANPNKRFPQNQPPRPMARVQEMGGGSDEDANGDQEIHAIAEVAQATSQAARGAPPGRSPCKGVASPQRPWQGEWHSPPCLICFLPLLFILPLFFILPLSVQGH
jgi:hypothetical protein